MKEGSFRLVIAIFMPLSNCVGGDTFGTGANTFNMANTLSSFGIDKDARGAEKPATSVNWMVVLAQLWTGSRRARAARRPTSWSLKRGDYPYLMQYI